MKNFKHLIFFFILLAGAVSGFLIAAETPGDTASPELITQGRDLFNKKEGLKVKFACILCHKGKKAIKASHVAKAGDKLPSVINKYLTKKSKGKALAEDSPEMQALIAYIRNEHAK